MAEGSAYVHGFGVCLPNAPVENEQIEHVLGVVGGSAKGVKRRILMNNGIRTRHYAIDPITREQSHTNAQITAEAIRALCQQTDFSLDHLSCLACGTASPDQLIPNHASMVQAELACGPCDLVATAGVCCSGMTALKYGFLHVASGCGPNAIVTGSELASVSLRADHFLPELRIKQSVCDEQQIAANPSIAFRNEFLRWMLSDGAGAALIQSRPRDDGISLRIDWVEVLSYAHRSDPCMSAGMVKSKDGKMRWYRGVTDPDEFFGDGLISLAQDVDILQDRLPVLMAEAIEYVRDKWHLTSDNIDWLAPHYSSQWFRQPLARGMSALGLTIPDEKWFSNLGNKGNTGAASIYIILDELMYSGRIQPRDRILCVVPESARMTFSFVHLTAL